MMQQVAKALLDKAVKAPAAAAPKPPLPAGGPASWDAQGIAAVLQYR